MSIIELQKLGILRDKLKMPVPSTVIEVVLLYLTCEGEGEKVDPKRYDECCICLRKTTCVIGHNGLNYCPECYPCYLREYGLEPSPVAAHAVAVGRSRLNKVDLVSMSNVQLGDVSEVDLPLGNNVDMRNIQIVPVPAGVPFLGELCAFTSRKIDELAMRSGMDRNDVIAMALFEGLPEVRRQLLI